MSTLMAPQLLSFRTVGLVLQCTSLAAAQKQPVKYHSTKRLHQLQSRGIDDGHISCCGLTAEEHHGCISH